MKKVSIYISLFITSVLLACGCIQDIFYTPSVKEGKEVDCTISFGSPAGPDVTVSTKGALGVMRESNVFNLYLLIFEGATDASKKYYGHYFTGENLGANSLSNWWEVTNMTKDNDNYVTHGTLHFKTTAHDGCTVVAIANLNPNDLDVSAGLLSTVKTYGDLKNIIATQIRSEVAANSGYFMMTAVTDGVNIGGSNDNMASKELVLQRLYAKVTFNVRIAKNAPIRSFNADKWQIVNVPTCCNLLPQASDAADTAEEFFTTELTPFDEEALDGSGDKFADGVTLVPTHSFTFYMMENRKNPNSLDDGKSWSDAASYTYREKQVSGTNPDRAFKYANAMSTYVVLTGSIVMNVNESAVGGNSSATLDAAVQYKIHLGDFSTTTGNNGNFDILRNHSYVYNIFINGADDIKYEVEHRGETGAEKEPGATGRVVIANETIYTSDCHYSTQVISFHYKFLTNPSQITWYVETPFNPTGTGPTSTDLTQIDYKWVEFRLNEKDPVTGKYTDRRVLYKPHDYDWTGVPELKNRTMYVNELVDYLKDQKALFDSDPASSDFDSTDPNDAKISLTAFVDEFYYTEDPRGGGWNPNLWKDYVVNQPMRRMHILASYKESDDKESSAIGSSLTIQQRSIQSIYAIHENADLHSAWGMEFIDDSRFETGLTQYWKTTSADPGTGNGDLGNTSPTNGRKNTMQLWGILDKNGNEVSTTRYWSDFLNLHSPNETAQLWTLSDPENPGGLDYHYLRYSCLSRNRDNNGNEIIDPEEIRWYMASDLQLIGVFLGSYGIEGDARLYQLTAAEQQAGGTNWRQHIVASNRYLPIKNKNSNLYPRVIWAEEGMNGSSLQYTGAGQTSVFSTRCIRNMGYYIDGGVRKDITTAAPDVEPDYYIKTTRKHKETNGSVTSPYTGAYDDNTFYEFDCSRINLASLRDPIDHELVGHDEFSRMACLSRGFEAAPVSECIDISDKTSYSFNGKSYNLTTYRGLNTYLDAAFGEFDAGFSVCPQGYRLPNVREMAVMWNVITDLPTTDTGYLGADKNTVPSRTYWSKGTNGTLVKDNNAWGWGMIDNKLLMATANGSNNHIVKKPRCVRDL